MPMPPFLKKKLDDAGAAKSGASESESESESASESESSASPAPKGGKVNPLKQWAKSKL